MKKFGLGIAACVAAFGMVVTGCNNNLAEIEDKDTIETSANDFVSVVSENKDLILMGITGDSSSRSVKLSDEEVLKYLENPQSLYDELNESEEGLCYLEFFNTVVNDSASADDILLASKNILSEEDYEVLEETVADLVLSYDCEESRAIATDKQAHIFAGSAVAMAASSVIYASISPVFVGKKIVAAAALSAAAGTTAGALKELVDYYDPNGTVDSGDFWATMLGSGIGATVAAGVASISFALLRSTTGAVIINGVFSLICGYTALHIVGKI